MLKPQEMNRYVLNLISYSEENMSVPCSCKTDIFLDKKQWGTKRRGAGWKAPQVRTQTQVTQSATARLSAPTSKDILSMSNNDAFLSINKQIHKYQLQWQPQ